MHLTFLIELYVFSPLFFVFLEALTFSKRKSKLFSGKIHSAYLSFYTQEMVVLVKFLLGLMRKLKTFED